MKNLNELTEAVHANALKHGWWENKPSTEHCLMLVVTEIAEMVEADRKGNVAVINHIRKQRNLAAAQKRRLTDDVDSAPDFIAAFDEMVKNTVEDDMADVVIRLLDLAGSFGLDFDKLTPQQVPPRIRPIQFHRKRLCPDQRVVPRKHQYFQAHSIRHPLHDLVGGKSGCQP